MKSPRVQRMALVAAAALLVSASSVSAADAVFHWQTDDEAGTSDLMFGEQPVLRYMFAYDPSTPERNEETYKVYHHVFGPGTDQIITKGAGGQFTHHRGLYVGWMKTNFDDKSYDFWHCKNGAHLLHVKFLEQAGDADSGTMTAEIHWNDPQGEPVIVEHRTLTVTKVPSEGEAGYGWQIDWSTKLTSRRGRIELNGDRQHAGFQFRAAQDVAEKNSARYIRPEGFPQQPEAYQVNDRTQPNEHVDLNWLAMTYPLEDQKYTIEYLESPNVPHPSRYSERPYGRFGAFFVTTITEDRPLTMDYRIIVKSGPVPTQEQIQDDYDTFVKSLSSSN